MSMPSRLPDSTNATESDTNGRKESSVADKATRRIRSAMSQYAAIVQVSNVNSVGDTTQLRAAFTAIAAAASQLVRDIWRAHCELGNSDAVLVIVEALEPLSPEGRELALKTVRMFLGMDDSKELVDELSKRLEDSHV